MRSALDGRELRAAVVIVLAALGLASLSVPESKQSGGCACGDLGEALSLCVCAVTGEACSASTGPRFCGAGVSVSAAPREGSRLRLSTWLTSARGLGVPAGLDDALEALASVRVGSTSSLEPAHST